MADHMTAEQSDDDLIVELVARYTADPVPPCRVCGGELGIQSFGGGRAAVWGCGGMEDDPDKPGYLRYQVDRKCADDHYSKSLWTQYRGGDSDVIELARRFHALAARLSGMAAVPEGWKLVPIEPNWDMRNEGREFLIDGLEKEPERLAYFLWKTMCAAAPEPPHV